MSFTVFLGNLPTWVTADDITAWLAAESLVADIVKVIRNPETQESKGFAFVEAPNAEEMQAIIRRFDRAPLEDSPGGPNRLLRANPAQPARSRKGPPVPVRTGPAAGPSHVAGPVASPVAGPAPAPHQARRTHRGGRKHRHGDKQAPDGPQSAFAEELAKAL